VSRPLPQPVAIEVLAALVGAAVEGDASTPIDRLASLESADARSLGFLTSRRLARVARASAAGALLVPPALAAEAAPGAVRVIVPDAYAAYARLSQWFAERLAPAEPPARIDPGAHVDPSARVGEGVGVAPGSVIAAGAEVGAGSRIGPGCVVGAGARLGPACRLVANVTVYPGAVLGARVTVHAGTVIGSDGFGFAPTAEGYLKVAQLGSVRIGDDVEIGANCAIDRGALDDTVIGDGVKIDNLVQVAHNVRIGEHTVIAGCVGIAGSATIGARCMIGGGVGIAGHLQICDGAVIGGFSLVERSVPEPGFYTGAWPLQEHAQWERTAATLKQLPQLRRRVRALEAPAGGAKDPE
jgi:UDP-3-O-[3-hydroxymyristoyl] glucosamine N-acyltransferase